MSAMATIRCPRCGKNVPLRKGKNTVCFECGWQSGVRSK